MSDVQSALGGARANGLVTLREAELTGMITVRGALDDIGRAVRDVTGVSMPGTRALSSAAGVSLAWMSPDELLVICGYGGVDQKVAALETALDGVHSLVVDVSDARAVFVLEGGAVRDVLAKLCPVDFDPAALPENSVRRTRLGQVPAALWFSDAETATVICFRSVADYVFGVLKGASTEGSPPMVFAKT